MPPLNLFSHNIDPAGVLDVLRDFGDLTVDGQVSEWTEATVRSKAGLFRKHSVTLGHSVEYYSEPEWSQQMSDMMGYFASFPDSAARTNTLRLVRSFRFALALPDQDFDFNEPERDPRLQVVFAVAKHLDAVLFQPGYLIDSTGRVLLDPSGESEPEAVLPATAELPGWYADGATGEEDGEAEEDEDYEPMPPDAEKVMRRALALAAITARALTEKEEPRPDDMEGFRRELNEWVSALGLDDELEPAEAEFLARQDVPDEQALVNAVWRIEGLAVLAWALGLADMPRYDQLVTPMELWKNLPALQDRGSPRPSGDSRA